MDEKPVVLITDDQELNVELLEVILQDQYQIVKAYNGLAALDILLKQKIDLLLLDVVMPIMDGFTLLKKLKARGITERIPVILITTETWEENVYKALDYGIEDMVAKPFDPFTVRERVNTAIRVRQLRQKKKEAEEGIEPPQEEAAQQMQPPPAPIPPEKKSHADTILLVDAREKERQLFSEMLEGEYPLEEVSSLQDACDAVENRAERFCLVIMDANLMEIGAAALIASLEQHSYDPPIPVLFSLSGSGTEEILDRIQYNLYDVIQIPYEIRVLRNRVRNLIALYTG